MQDKLIDFVVIGSTTYEYVVSAQESESVASQLACTLSNADCQAVYNKLVSNGTIKTIGEHTAR